MPDVSMLDLYTLPTIDFVGGETQELMFHAYFHKNRRPFGLTGCTANFAVVSFSNKMGAPILTKAMKITSGGADDNNVLSVTIEPSETVGLYGKYIYQIQIKDTKGIVEIPKQGFLYVINNINKSFIR